jgi:hypothetical protein
MELRIRRVDVATDREELLGLLQRNLPDVIHQQRFRWLYCNNPVGPAHSWFLCDKSGTAVGTTALFPRAVWIDDTPALCGQVGDFGIDPAFRSLGPAISLQRATFGPVKLGAMAFCYDCPPHEKGMAMFRRLGLQENCRMRTYVKPLRLDRQMTRLLGRKAGRAAALVANPLLAIAANTSARRGLDFTFLACDFDAEFSELDDAVKTPGAIRNRRRAEDLNWRFRRNPLQTFEVLTARRNGELAGYAVFAVIGEDALLFDLFARKLEEVGPSLLQVLSDLLRERSIQTVRSTLAGDATYISIFRQAGFLLRADAARVVAFAGPGDSAGGNLLRDARWQFQHADLMA